MLRSLGIFGLGIVLGMPETRKQAIKYGKKWVESVKKDLGYKDEKSEQTDKKPTELEPKDTL